MRRTRTSLVQRIALATILVLAPSLIGCSRSGEGEAEAYRDRQNTYVIGKHFYACPDASRLEVDFLGDGLTLDIKTHPRAAAVRVTSPASGWTYVGRNLNVSISGGNWITIKRPRAPAVMCTRALAYRDTMGRAGSRQATGSAV